MMMRGDSFSHDVNATFDAIGRNRRKRGDGPVMSQRFRVGSIPVHGPDFFCARAVRHEYDARADQALYAEDRPGCPLHIGAQPEWRPVRSACRYRFCRAPARLADSLPARYRRASRRAQTGCFVPPRSRCRDNLPKQADSPQSARRMPCGLRGAGERQRARDQIGRLLRNLGGIHRLRDKRQCA